MDLAGTSHHFSKSYSEIDIPTYIPYIHTGVILYVRVAEFNHGRFSEVVCEIDDEDCPIRTTTTTTTTTTTATTEPTTIEETTTVEETTAAETTTTEEEEGESSQQQQQQIGTLRMCNQG